jgi:hypothetical protein
MPIAAATATAVLRVIGIVLMTNNPADHGMIRAIAPRIPSIGNVPIKDVEPHTAFLAFPAADYVSSRGWAPARMSVVQGMLFVKLDGEQLTINGQHATALPPRSMPEAPAAAMEQRRAALPRRQVPSVQRQGPTPPSEPTGLGILLPHLKTECCAHPGELRTEFKPPLFSGAAGVLELPAGSVLPSTCKSLNGRIDTHLSIPNDGKITIAARKGAVKKEIVLQGTSTEIYLGNLPTWFLDGSMTQHDMGRPHYEAYFMMTDSTECSFTQKVPVPECDGLGYGRTYFREGIATGAASATPPPKLSVLANARIDVECSNSQWP